MTVREGGPAYGKGLQRRSVASAVGVMMLVMGLVTIGFSGPAAADGPPGEAFTASWSPVAAAPNADGTLELFEAMPNHGPVVHRHQTSTGWSPWEQFNGWLTSIAAATNADGRVQVFGWNDSGDLWTRAESAPNGTAGWDGWFQILHSPAASPAINSVAVAHNADGRLELVYVAGGVTYVRSQQTANSSYSWGPERILEDVSVCPNGMVAAQTNGTGRVEIIGRNCNGLFEYRMQTAPNAASYTNWVSIGSGGGLNAIGDRLALGRDTDGRLEIAFLHSDGTVLLKWETAPGSNDWAGGFAFDGWLNSVALATNSDGRLQLFGTNHLGDFWTRSQIVAGGGTGWNGWSPIDQFSLGG